MEFLYAMTSHLQWPRPTMVLFTANSLGVRHLSSSLRHSLLAIRTHRLKHAHEKLSSDPARAIHRVKTAFITALSIDLLPSIPSTRCLEASSSHTACHEIHLSSTVIQKGSCASQSTISRSSCICDPIVDREIKIIAAFTITKAC